MTHKNIIFIVHEKTEGSGLLFMGFGGQAALMGRLRTRPSKWRQVREL